MFSSKALLLGLCVGLICTACFGMSGRIDLMPFCLFGASFSMLVATMLSLGRD